MVHRATTFVKGDMVFGELNGRERVSKLEIFSALFTADFAFDQVFDQLPLKI